MINSHDIVTVNNSHDIVTAVNSHDIVTGITTLPVIATHIIFKLLADLKCMDFPLAEEPNFGTWRIDVNFKVQQLIILYRV